jgi:hypothetical protein
LGFFVVFVLDDDYHLNCVSREIIPTVVGTKIVFAIKGRGKSRNIIECFRNSEVWHLQNSQNDALMGFYENDQLDLGANNLQIMFEKHGEV